MTVVITILCSSLQESKLVPLSNVKLLLFTQETEAEVQTELLIKIGIQHHEDLSDNFFFFTVFNGQTY